MRFWEWNRKKVPVKKPESRREKSHFGFPVLSDAPRNKSSVGVKFPYGGSDGSKELTDHRLASVANPLHKQIYDGKDIADAGVACYSNLSAVLQEKRFINRWELRIDSEDGLC